MTSSLSLCAQEIRNNEHDQFLCGLLAPEEKQTAFFAMQLFYMETSRIRDLVSEPHLGLIRLQWWRDVIDNIYNGQSEHMENGAHKEVVDVLSTQEISHSLFNRYLNARAFDMEDRAHDDMPALLRYCEATGGQMAQIKSTAIGAGTSDAALKIGTAAAIYYLVRTLAHQSRVARCKLPIALARKHDLDINGYYKFETSDGLKACVKELSDEILRLIAEARETKTPSNAVLLSTVSMEDYLKRLSKVEYDPFNPHIGQGRFTKQFKLMTKMWMSRY